jgi:Fis family transcriptional regulator
VKGLVCVLPENIFFGICNILRINLKLVGQKLVKLTLLKNNINTSKIASMNSTNLPACINAKLNRYFKQLDGEKVSGVFKMVMQESEAITIKFILDMVEQNQSEAAKILGMNRGTLKKKIELYKLK